MTNLMVWYIYYDEYNPSYYTKVSSSLVVMWWCKAVYRNELSHVGSYTDPSKNIYIN